MTKHKAVKVYVGISLFVLAMAFLNIARDLFVGDPINNTVLTIAAVSVFAIVVTLVQLLHKPVILVSGVVASACFVVLVIGVPLEWWNAGSADPLMELFLFSIFVFMLTYLLHLWIDPSPLFLSNKDKEI